MKLLLILAVFLAVWSATDARKGHRRTRKHKNLMGDEALDKDLIDTELVSPPALCNMTTECKCETLPQDPCQPTINLMVMVDFSSCFRHSFHETKTYLKYVFKIVGATFSNQTQISLVPFGDDNATVHAVYPFGVNEFRKIKPYIEKLINFRKTSYLNTALTFAAKEFKMKADNRYPSYMLAITNGNVHASVSLDDIKKLNNVTVIPITRNNPYLSINNTVLSIISNGYSSGMTRGYKMKKGRHFNRWMNTILESPATQCLPPPVEATCTCSSCGQCPAPAPQITGPKGLKGEKTDSGKDGMPGHSGPPGTHGQRGPKGLRGPKGGDGARGPKGKVGLKGPKGLMGDIGDVGDTGPDGLKGKDGLQGEPGLNGGKGEMGLIGIKGTKGLVGMKGNKGEKGIIGTDGKGTIGSKGLPGNNGTMGESGLPRPPGVPGEEGVKGCAGCQGAKGVAGSKGEYGAAGVDGNPGVNGPPGIQGPPGNVGMPGIEGNSGPAGMPGPDGQTGVDGSPGSPGIQGRRGPQGPRGPPSFIPGHQGARGHPGVKGNDGIPGSAGDIGLAGPRGIQGPKGQQGTSGDCGVNYDIVIQIVEKVYNNSKTCGGGCCGKTPKDETADPTTPLPTATSTQGRGDSYFDFQLGR